MRFCFAFNAMIDQTYMPADKQDINIDLGVIPLIELLERHPRIKSALFFTGYTDQMLAERWPDLVARIRSGVTAGRYEIGTYTYTHPLLSLIPYEDLDRQLRVGLDIDEQVWGVRPMGTILPEGSWDPSLSKAFADAGIAWTLVSTASYLMDHPKAGPAELCRPVALRGTFGTSIPAVFVTGLQESFWPVIEGKQTEEQYFQRIEQAIAAGAQIYVDKSDFEFLYLALPRVTKTAWGDGTREQIEPFVRRADAMLSRLEQIEGLEFVLVGEYLAARADLPVVDLRPGMGWKDLSEWLRGSEKVACVTDEARQHIQTAELMLVLAEKLGMDVTAARRRLEQAWDWLLRAETSIGRRACAHPQGQPSRIVAALEHAALARQAAREAVQALSLPHKPRSRPASVAATKQKAIRAPRAGAGRPQKHDTAAEKPRARRSGTRKG